MLRMLIAEPPHCFSTFTEQVKFLRPRM